MAVVVPALGPGAIYLPVLDATFRAHPDLIKVAEIEPQTLWVRASTPSARPRGSSDTLRRLHALPQSRLLHGVGAPVGGRHCDQSEHVGIFAEWSRTLDAPWVSEHLSVLDVEGVAGPVSSGFLMPPWQNDAGAALAGANIRARRQALGKPFAFETGVNYFRRRPDEMPDGMFFAAVAEMADCGIVLDLHNLWTNQRNGRASIASVIAALPLDRVWEVHLAGGVEHDGWWLDAHTGAIDPDLLAIAAEVVPMLPQLGAILFEIAPDRAASFGETALLTEIEALHRLWEKRPETDNPSNPDRSALSADDVPRASPEGAAGVTSWENRIACAMLPTSLAPAAPSVPEDDPAWHLYHSLVASFRKGVLTSLLNETVRLLLRTLEPAALDTLFAAYFDTRPPALYASDEALAFADWLAVNLPDRFEPAADLRTLLAFEAGVVRAIVDDLPLPPTGGIEAVLQRCVA